MTWNPFKLQPPFNPRHGLIITSIRFLIALPAWPLDIVHKLLDNIISKIVHVAGGSDETVFNVSGYFIELWVVLWACLNIFVFLPYFSSANWVYLSFPFFFLILRAGDFMQKFLVFNFYLSYDALNKKTEPQRSVARSYTILILNFLETAAMFASLHFIIYRQFLTEKLDAQNTIIKTASGWQDLYYYCFMNMRS